MKPVVSHAGYLHKDQVEECVVFIICKFCTIIC